MSSSYSGTATGRWGQLLGRDALRSRPHYLRDRVPPDVQARAVAGVALKRAGPPTDGRKVSVLICTRDRPDELRRCLASLPQQTLRPREVIVIDNASRDGRTREVALAAGAIYLREERPGLDIARNAGARRATSSIVAYTDDDVLLHPTWLERLVAAFDGPQIAAVTGLVLPAELATEAQRHFETYWSFGRGYLRRDFDAQQFAAAHRGGLFRAWEIGAGASMAFRREVFDRVGYFDERLDVGQAGCSGDSEIWYRVLATAWPAATSRARWRFITIAARSTGWRIRSTTTCAGMPRRCWCSGSEPAPGNRRRAFVAMPKWYAGRVWRRLRGAARRAIVFCARRSWAISRGLVFYLRRRQGRRL